MIARVASAAALVVSLAVSPLGETLEPGGTFLDDDGSFAEPSIEALYAAGITKGCSASGTRFCPEATLSRAEAAGFLDRALPPPGGPIESRSFPDVPADAWYAEPVRRSAARGLVVGFEDGSFRPTEPLSRAELAAILSRMLGGATPDPAPLPAVFTDVPADGWYAAAVEHLRSARVTVGCERDPPSFCPDQPATRDQMAVFLTRALGLVPLPPPPRVAPLDGLPVDGVASARRAVAVKVDNARGGRPQSGVQEADAMIEILVEGGLTRWMALFHRSDSAFVGPVRSGRPTDIGMVLPLGAVMVASGGQQWILDAITAAGVTVLDEKAVDAAALFRTAGRVAPHNLYGNTVALRAAATAAGLPDTPPDPLFDWGSLPDDTAPDSTVVTLDWSDPVAVTWAWDGSTYRRWMYGAPHEWVGVDGERGQITADNLIVIIAPVYEAAPPRGVPGSAVPALDTVGEGPLLLYSEGKVVRGRWRRAAATDWFEFTDLSGGPLTVPPGAPWINVFPAGRAIRS